VIWKSVISLVYSDGEIKGDDDFAGLMRSLRSAARQVSRATLTAIISRADPLGAAEIVIRELPALNQRLIALLCHSRVLCLTEDCDNQVMWSHYADEHRGVVFKLRCGHDVNTVLNSARKVVYTDKFVPMPDMAELLGHAAGISRIDFDSFAFQLACSKHLDWAYEKEWRIHRGLSEHEPVGDGFDFYREPEDVFEAIYLGCRMLPDKVSMINEAAKRFLPNIQIFQGKMRTDSFGLTFEPMQNDAERRS
jgi:hypothetical protein